MYDVIVVGGGPAGLAAAIEARNKGAEKVLVVERDKELGGILNQCIHNGFGLHYFEEELTGPEYAGRFVSMLEGSGIEVRLDTMVMKITPEKDVCLLNQQSGYQVEKAKAIVLAMGCRERARGAIGIPGTRPAGVMTAGTAQRYVNMEGFMPGRRVVILGSGDIGLIMARRMTLEGAKVLACVEVLPYPGGLNRNIVQCLEDYDIPLYLSYTIVDIKGKQRVEKVVIAKVDENRRPIPGTELEFDCDTVLLSVGLIPENELSRAAGVEIDATTKGAKVFENMETSIPGVFACGNVLHVHDLVDFVTSESQKAGASAAAYAAGVAGQEGQPFCTVQPGELVSYTLPQRVRVADVAGALELSFRVRASLPKGQVVVHCGDRVIARFKREHMAPGEMEHLKIPKKLLESLTSGDTITVDVLRKEDAYERTGVHSMPAGMPSLSANG